MSNAKFAESDVDDLLLAHEYGFATKSDAPKVQDIRAKYAKAVTGLNKTVKVRLRVRFK